jgi:hypothetical protein
MQELSEGLDLPAELHYYVVIKTPRAERSRRRNMHMRRSTLRSHLTALLSGLLLAACGGVPEAELLPAAEPLGTEQSALCSGLSVTNLTLSDVSTYGGLMSGVGNWAVSLLSNAVRLEYYVDGVLRSTDDRPGFSGSWYFSTSGIACGPRTFTVKAYPMVIDSNNNRTVCYDSPRVLTQTVTEPCPNPTASVSCSRSTTLMVRCTGSATGGSGTYTTYYWQDWEYGYPNGWLTGSTTRSFYCPQSTTQGSTQWRYDFKVIDSNGRESNVATRYYTCGIDLR